MPIVPRIIATDKAKELIKKLKEMHGPLMFHQSDGCCDGSQPMCFADREFRIGNSDVYLGEIEDCKFYMSKDQFEYVKFTQLTFKRSVGKRQQLFLKNSFGCLLLY